MPEMDANDSDQDADSTASDPATGPQTEADERPAPPWVLTLAQSPDWHKNTGLLTENSNNDDDNLWSIPWANLMMVLFAIMFMLISLQSKDEQTKASTTTLTVQDPVNIATQEPGSIRSASQPVTTAAVTNQADTGTDANIALLLQFGNSQTTSNSEQVRISHLAGRSIKLMLGVDRLFESGTAELLQPAPVMLDQLAEILQLLKKPIQIIGHTDDQIIDSIRYPDNWALSLAQASAVMRYLVEVGRLDASRFTVSGRAQHQPVTSNLIASSRAQNRRVEIIILLDGNPQTENKP